MEKRITGIMRDASFAPNGGFERDSALMRAVADILKDEGWDVELCGEDRLLDMARDNRTPSPLVMTMVRHPISMLALRAIERKGAHIVNSPQSLVNCVRSRCVRTLHKAGIPMPATVVLDGEECDFENLEGIAPCWVKRGDVCTQDDGGIIFCRDDHELNRALHNIMRLTPHSIVVSKHVEGQLVKFYGVTGTTFFRAFSAEQEYHDTSLMESVCRKAAEALELDVWGGDCIIDASGHLHIIDFNDWPSFGLCRDEAARAIASRISVLGRDGECPV